MDHIQNCFNTNSVTTQAQNEFNAHVGRIQADDAVNGALKKGDCQPLLWDPVSGSHALIADHDAGLDPRKTQSARTERKSDAFYLRRRMARDMRPGKTSFISMTGTPPIAYVPKDWRDTSLPTEAAEQAKSPWSDPDARLHGCKPPSSSSKYYRLVRVATDVKDRARGKPGRHSTSPTFPSTATNYLGTQHPGTGNAGSHASPSRNRLPTAPRSMSASVNPITKADTLRLQGWLSVEGGLLYPGDVRAPPAVTAYYPQPCSELKKLRHDVWQKDSRPPFRTFSVPLKPGVYCAADYQKDLNGTRPVLPSEFWSGPESSTYY